MWHNCLIALFSNQEYKFKLYNVTYESRGEGEQMRRGWAVSKVENTNPFLVFHFRKELYIFSIRRVQTYGNIKKLAIYLNIVLKMQFLLQFFNYVSYNFIRYECIKSKPLKK